MAAASYAVASLVIGRIVGDGDAVGVIAVILAVNTVVLTPAALPALPDQVPDVSATVSIVALGVLCTAVAFMAYFALLAEAGPSRGAVVLRHARGDLAAAAVVLDEPVTVATLLELVLIVAGSRLATRGTSESVVRPR